MRVWCQKNMKFVENEDCAGCKDPCSYQVGTKDQGLVKCYVENKMVMTCSHFECIQKRDRADLEHAA